MPLSAFDPNWNAAVLYTQLIRPDDHVVSKSAGSVDELRLKGMMITNLADDDYLGHQAC